VPKQQQCSSRTVLYKMFTVVTVLQRNDEDSEGTSLPILRCRQFIAMNEQSLAGLLMLFEATKQCSANLLQHAENLSTHRSGCEYIVACCDDDERMPTRVM